MRRWASQIIKSRKEWRGGKKEEKAWRERQPSSALRLTGFPLFYFDHREENYLTGRQKANGNDKTIRGNTGERGI